MLEIPGRYLHTGVKWTNEYINLAQGGSGEMGLINLRITDTPLIFKSTEFDEVT